MFVLLAFISFYVPCVSTFAVLLKQLGRRDAWFSVALSIAVALLVAGLLRVGGTAADLLAA
jgi:ferrous iron transport protein B